MERLVKRFDVGVMGGDLFKKIAIQDLNVLFILETDRSKVLVKRSHLKFIKIQTLSSLTENT
jgi:hypothetical protein